MTETSCHTSHHRHRCVKEVCEGEVLSILGQSLPFSPSTFGKNNKWRKKFLAIFSMMAKNRWQIAKNRHNFCLYGKNCDFCRHLVMVKLRQMAMIPNFAFAKSQKNKKIPNHGDLVLLKLDKKKIIKRGGSVERRLKLTSSRTRSYCTLYRDTG